MGFISENQSLEFKRELEDLIGKVHDLGCYDFINESNFRVLALVKSELENLLCNVQ